MKRAVRFWSIFALCLGATFGVSDKIPANVAGGGNAVVWAATSKPSINKKTATIKVNKTLTLKVKKVPATVKKVTWSTTNKKVVRIQGKTGAKKQNAVVLGVGYGNATVRAKVGTTTLKTAVTVSCAHNWAAATCTEPKTCKICGETSGEALGHEWADATCTEAKKCTRCGETDGSALGHTWAAATCTTAKTCTVCGMTEGEPLGHLSANDGTCQEQATCSRCGERVCGFGDHKYNDDGYCAVSGCDEIDLNYWLPMFIWNYGTATRSIGLYTGNYMVGVDVTFGDVNLTSTRAYTADFYPSGSGEKVNAILLNAAGSTVQRRVVAAKTDAVVEWLKDDSDVISIDSKLEFEISFTYPRHAVTSGSVTLFTVPEKDYQYHVSVGADITEDSNGLPYGCATFTRLN